MKKILLLGGSAQQVTAIETAKRLGYETVLCDYLADNPGQYAADRFFLVSTTDREAVLRVAREEAVGGVLAYASDPAAPTAAFVAQELGLPGNPLESVEILCDKARFRRFLAENHFATPLAKSYRTVKAAHDGLGADGFRFPVVIKPTDSSGSKGVAVLRSADGCKKKIAAAFSFSRSHTVIAEEYVETDTYQVAGDGLSVNGELVFRCFGNDHFDAAAPNPLVPVAASFPSILPDALQERIHAELQRLISLLCLRTCTYNFDIRVGKDGRVYLMEVAPRDGGNYIPQVIDRLTGVNLAEISVRAAMGETIAAPRVTAPKGCCAYYAVHSRTDGILDRIEIDRDFLQRHLVADYLTAKSGDAVRAFTGANTALGCLLLRFDSVAEMTRTIDRADEWIQLHCKG